MHADSTAHNAQFDVSAVQLLAYQE